MRIAELENEFRGLCREGVEPLRTKFPCRVNCALFRLRFVSSFFSLSEYSMEYCIDWVYVVVFEATDGIEYKHVVSLFNVFLTLSFGFNIIQLITTSSFGFSISRLILSATSARFDAIYGAHGKLITFGDAMRNISISHLPSLNLLNV